MTHRYLTEGSLLTALCLVFVLGWQVACEKRSLIGKWNRVQEGNCYRLYPDKLEFFDDGTYVGALPNWNGGNYKVIENNRLRLDTLTGPGVYEFKMAANELTFQNDSKCEFRYTRAK